MDSMGLEYREIVETQGLASMCDRLAGFLRERVEAERRINVHGPCDMPAYVADSYRSTARAYEGLGYRVINIGLPEPV